MNKKIISGISLALVLVMFAVLLAGCVNYDYAFGKYGTDDASKYIKWASVIVKQEEDGGAYKDNFKVEVSLTFGRSRLNLTGTASGCSASALKNGVSVQVADSNRENLEEVTVKIPALAYKEGKKVTPTTIYVKYHTLQTLTCNNS